MATNVTHVALDDGPSKFDLMLALFDRKPKPRIVTFVAFDGAKCRTHILGMQSMDTSGEHWDIEARPVGWKEGSLTISFRTDIRQGYLDQPY